MLDFHYHPEAWGIWPVAFYIGELPVTTYFIFSLIGLIAASLIFYLLSSRQKLPRTQSLFIIMAGLMGGAIGAKIPILLMYGTNISAGDIGWDLLLTGKTITGGLIGGMILVWIVKKSLKINFRIGNALAPAVAIAIALGRIGCFFTGCCYGKPTNIDGFGFNFGDGVLRHPTQLYEVLFSVIQFVVFIVLLGINENSSENKKFLKPGMLFDWYIITYFLFRFLLEFIKEEPFSFMSLTVFQWLAIIVIGKYFGSWLFNLLKVKRNGEDRES